MSKLSPHFNSAEFECRGRDGCKSISPPATFLAALERLREICGNQPLKIISGYRCSTRNSQVGGAPRSRHLMGDAADIPEGYATVEQAVRAGFKGIGSKGRWAIHVDTRPSPARWTY